MSSCMRPSPIPADIDHLANLAAIGRKLRDTLLLRHHASQVRGHKILDVYSGAKMVV